MSKPAPQMKEPLRGWKQIGAYLHRDIRTVQRWERSEHLPVHRQLHQKLGSVHALSSELDEWLANRTVPQSRELGQFPTRDPRAYEMYVKGRQQFHQFRRKSFEHARELFSRAIGFDADCAIAHAGFADCCSYLYLYWQPTMDNLRAADSAAAWPGSGAAGLHWPGLRARSPWMGKTPRCCTTSAVSMRSSVARKRH